MADIPTRLLTPLRECPAGSRVVYGRNVYLVGVSTTTVRTHLCPHSITGECLSPLSDTLVLLLEGDEPRPLRECVSRDVWHPGYGSVWSANGGAGWITPPGVFVSPHGVQRDSAVWPIVVPEPADDGPQDAHTAPQWVALHEGDEPGPSNWSVYPDDDGGEGDALCTGMSEHGATALAEHLTGWTPPEPEPERLSWQTIAADWARTSTDSEGWLPIDEIEHDFAEHGYVVVDRRSLEEAVNHALRRADGTSHMDVSGRSYDDVLDELVQVLRDAALYPEEADR